MHQNNILRLAALLLRKASEEFSNHGCNDIEAEELEMTPEQWEELNQAMTIWGRTPDARGSTPCGSDFEQSGDHNMDFLIMDFCADMLDAISRVTDIRERNATEQRVAIIAGTDALFREIDAKEQESRKEGRLDEAEQQIDIMEGVARVLAKLESGEWGISCTPENPCLDTNNCANCKSFPSGSGG